MWRSLVAARTPSATCRSSFLIRMDRSRRWMSSLPLAVRGGGPALAGGRFAAAQQRPMQRQPHRQQNRFESRRFMWWPSDGVETALESLHSATGMPWWLTIVSSTIVIRAIMLPLVIKQMKGASQMSLLKPELTAIQRRLKEASQLPDAMKSTAAVLEQQQQLKELYTKNGLNPLKMFIVPFVQMPVFLSYFFALKSMSASNPTFHSGGALWFTDLSTADPTLALPLISAATFLLTIELGADTGVKHTGGIKWFMRALAVAMVPLTMGLSKAIFMYWCTSNAFSLASSQAFKLPAVRAALGMPSLEELRRAAVQSAAGSPPEKSFSQMWEELKKRRETAAVQEEFLKRPAPAPRSKTDGDASA